MQLPKITPIAIGIFIIVTCLVASAIYYYIHKKDEPATMATYAYSILPAALIAVLVVFGYDRYSAKNELLQEGFYS